jgi:hypothetical protein
MPRASGRDTNVVLLAAGLHGEAWLALLVTRPGIGAVAATSDLAQVPGQLRQGEPNAVLVDRADGRPDTATRLRSSCADAGLLFLVES